LEGREPGKVNRRRQMCAQKGVILGGGERSG